MIWDLTKFAKKHVLFIGHGREGRSFERFIKTYGNPLSFRFIDQQNGASYLDELLTVDTHNTIVVKTPGCPGHQVPIEYTTPTRVFFECVRQLGARVVGITGTKGKSTTTALIGHVLAEAGLDVHVCGNIGVPMLDTLPGPNDPSRAESVFVTELSSYQLADLEYSPDIAVITNLYTDHVQYHGGQDAYWEAKRNIVRYMPQNGIVVYNPDFDRIRQWIDNSACMGRPIQPSAPVNMTGWHLWGKHNMLNALMAVEVAHSFGIPREVSLEAIRHFEGLPHRLQRVRTVGGVTYIDDAIGSHPEATISAINAVHEQGEEIGCLMLGGSDRSYDFSALGILIQQYRIPYLVLFPDTGKKIRQSLVGGYLPECFETKDMQEGVAWAEKHCMSGTVCLLSTASPSYSLWSDFEEKGQCFQDSVRALGQT